MNATDQIQFESLATSQSQIIFKMLCLNKESSFFTEDNSVVTEMGL